jgi:hypothetical protein
MGRKMKEWVQIDRKNSKDYIKEKSTLKESSEYVLSLIKKK